MDDGFEVSYKLSPMDEDVLLDNGYPESYNRATFWEGNLDLDGDGISTLDEYALGTNPQLADTDGDRYPDDFEIAWESSPVDMTDHPGKEYRPWLPPDQDQEVYATAFVRKPGANPWEHSYNTIAEAVANFSSAGHPEHAIIKVYPGTYNESFSFSDYSVGETKILIVSVGGPQVTEIIGLNNASVVHLPTHNVVLDGFTIRHADGTQGNGVQVGNGGPGTPGQVQPFQTRVSRCIIRNNSGFGVQSYGGCSIYNCIIAYNGGQAVDNGPNWGATTLRNVTLYNNGYISGSIGVFQNNDASSISIANSILWNDYNLPASQPQRPSGFASDEYFYLEDPALTEFGYVTGDTPSISPPGWPNYNSSLVYDPVTFSQEWESFRFFEICDVFGHPAGPVSGTLTISSSHTARLGAHYGYGYGILVTEYSLPDTDNDGMPDFWEIAHGLDPLDSSDASSDPDGDGYINIDEYVNGTDPWVPDGITPLPYVTGFELEEGYSFGDLNQQDNWIGSQGTALVQNMEVFSGLQATGLSGFGARASHYFEDSSDASGECASSLFIQQQHLSSYPPAGEGEQPCQFRSRTRGHGF